MYIKRIIVGYLNTNCYIIEKNDQCIIIDPGSDVEKIKDNIDKKVVGILITHNHFDHIGALTYLEKEFDVKHYDYYNLNEGRKNIGVFNFEVIYNLGHTLDSVSYVFENNMFCGDYIFKDGIGRCDLRGNIKLMKESIKKTIKYTNNYKLYPGHGDSTYLFDEVNNLKKYI